jgi:hypothetical protein
MIEDILKAVCQAEQKMSEGDIRPIVALTNWRQKPFMHNNYPIISHF